MFMKYVEDVLDNIDKEKIVSRVSNILGMKDNIIEIDQINKNLLIKGMGQHSNGLISINPREISINLNNILINFESETLVGFLQLFVEAIIVHELHHLYLYKFNNIKYLNYIEEDIDIPYRSKRLEIEADNFMILYMNEIYRCQGTCVGEISKVLRTLPFGERKNNEISELVEKYIEFN